MSGIIGSSHNIRGSGVVAKLGTDGQIFTSAGAGLSQGFEAAAGGGKVLQCVQGTSSTASQGAETSFTDTGLNVTITCAATSSKVLVIVHTTGLAASGGQFTWYTIERQISGGSDTNIGDATTGLNLQRGDTTTIGSVAMHILDSPSTTSAITYECQRKVDTGSGACMYGDTKSIITATEIGA